MLSSRLVNKAYREDIQGIRALGSLIIMVFHIWFNKVSGGVDIFIVISGYLLVGVYIARYTEYDSLASFYFNKGILLRVLPSAILILIISLVMGEYFLPFSELEKHYKEHIASVFQIENIQLIRSGREYLDQSTIPSPFQHFWALSVQIQIYFIFSFVSSVLLFLFKGSAKVFFLNLVLLTLVSFVYSIFAVSENQAAAYYNTFARFWEFGIGGVIFLILHTRKNWNLKYDNIIGWLGLALLFYSALVIPRGAAYPGPVALFPVVSAALLIVSGMSSKGIVNRFLCNKIMVWLGGFSFLIYLWHWPILIYWKVYFDVENIGVVSGLLIIFISVVFSYITYAFWERSILQLLRKSKSLNQVVFMFVICLLSVLYSAYSLREHRSNISQGVEALKSNDYLWDYNFKNFNQDEVSREELIYSKFHLPDVYYDGCYTIKGSNRFESCYVKYSESNDKFKVHIVGGSHIGHWLPAVGQIFSKENLEVKVTIVDSCTFGVRERDSQFCKRWNEWAFEKLVDEQPDLVLVSSTDTSYEVEKINVDLIDKISFLKKTGVDFLGIRDTPRFKENIPNCLFSPEKQCLVERKKIGYNENPAVDFEEFKYHIDMIDYMCDKTYCYPSTGGRLIFRDKDHLTTNYSKALSEPLSNKIFKKYPELFQRISKD